MYPTLQADPDRAAWIETTAAELARFGEQHRARARRRQPGQAVPARALPRARQARLPRPAGPASPTAGWAAASASTWSSARRSAGTAWSPGRSRRRGSAGCSTGAATSRRTGGCAASRPARRCSPSRSARRTRARRSRPWQSTATRDGGDWLLTGGKTHVNLGADCDVTLFYAIAEEGLTSFLVDMSLPGIATAVTDPVGLRLIRTADVTFDRVRVPDSALLGPPGGGLQTFLSTFNISRLGNASELIGLGRRSLELGLRYASQRQVGDSMVTDFQGIQWMVADAWTAPAGRVARPRRRRASPTSAARTSRCARPRPSTWRSPPRSGPPTPPTA